MLNVIPPILDYVLIKSFVSFISVSVCPSNFWRTRCDANIHFSVWASVHIYGVFFHFYSPFIYFSTAILTNVEIVKFLSFAYFCTFSNIVSPNTFRQNIKSPLFLSVLLLYYFYITLSTPFRKFLKKFYKKSPAFARENLVILERSSALARVICPSPLQFHCTLRERS